MSQKEMWGLTWWKECINKIHGACAGFEIFYEKELLETNIYKIASSSYEFGIITMNLGSCTCDDVGEIAIVESFDGFDTVEDEWTHDRTETTVEL